METDIILACSDYLFTFGKKKDLLTIEDAQDPPRDENKLQVGRPHDQEIVCSMFNLKWENKQSLMVLYPPMITWSAASACNR